MAGAGVIAKGMQTEGKSRLHPLPGANHRSPSPFHPGAPACPPQTKMEAPSQSSEGVASWNWGRRLNPVETPPCPPPTPGTLSLFFPRQLRGSFGSWWGVGGGRGGVSV